MSSTEPPSRVPPRQQPHETKAAREELSSKGKVEKVREVDPDEQARKRKFLQYYKGVEEEPKDSRMSPFDVYSGKKVAAEGTLPPPASSSASSFSDVESAMIPGPSYSAPPNVQSSFVEEEGSASENALPRSGSFWQEYSLPDDSSQKQPQFQETPGLSKEFKDEKKVPSQTPLSEHAKRTEEIKKKEKEVLEASSKIVQKKEDVLKAHHHQKAKKEERIPQELPLRPSDEMKKEKAVPEKKKEEISLFGPPGKPLERQIPERQIKEEKEKKGALPPFTREKPEELAKKKPPKSPEQPLPSPFEQIAAPATRPHETTIRGAPIPKHKEKQKEETISPLHEGSVAFVKPEEKGEGGEKRQDKEHQILEIESPSLPQLPSHIQPMAVSATTQASPYLNSATVALFYQMVGTMYVMSGGTPGSTPGVNRTEIVLNNPSFANSKFYGAKITIEKYATAPDSFNIRLSGTHEAVTSFKDNVPSLLTAFQNGNFLFRVGRLDVEYTLDRPVFRRKEKGEDKGDSGGGDLGDKERRNR